MKQARYIHDYSPSHDELVAAKLISSKTGKEDATYSQEHDLFPLGRTAAVHFNFLSIRGKLAQERGDMSQAKEAFDARESWLHRMTRSQRSTYDLLGTDRLG